MTCPNPFPERLNPPEQAGECAICHRVTEDGRNIELCDEAVEALRDAGAITKRAKVTTGRQFVCEGCLDVLFDAQGLYAHISSALETITDALKLDDYEHPELRARKVVAMVEGLRGEVQRLQSICDVSDTDGNSVLVTWAQIGEAKRGTPQA